MFLTKLKSSMAILAVLTFLGAGVAGPVYLGEARERGRRAAEQASGVEPPQARPARPAEPAPRTGQRNASANLAEQETWRTASVWDRYRNLLKIIEVADDRQNYGDFREYGLWQGTSYAGQDNLPVGYWVYVFPNWYIWGALKGGEPQDVARASVGGNYCILLKTLEVKEDRKNYGDFMEYGPWSGSSYAGQNELPAGYWVYVYPKWYIWGARRSAPAQNAEHASVNRKYRRLLRKIAVEEDKATYGAFVDYGHYASMKSYAGHEDLPEGYWVYVYPYWYIWGDR
jgi:hypothetical protein